MKTTKALWLAFLFFASISLAAQTTYWQMTIGSGPESYGSSKGNAIAVDGSGNSYVTGEFTGTAVFGSTALVSSGGTDIFVGKMNSSGSWLWAKKAGGTSGDIGKSIVLDSSGNVYITGSFTGTATWGTTSLTSSGSTDIYWAKLNSSGAWQWAYRAGGTGADAATCMAISSANTIYIAGTFEETAHWFKPGTGMSATSLGSTDIFVCKVSSSGIWDWVSRAGGTSADLVNGIALDSSSNVYVTGSFSGTAGFSSYSLTSSGSTDIFVAKISSSLWAWQWAVNAGGAQEDVGYGIALDSSSNIYVSGSFKSTATFGSLTPSLVSSGLSDIVVAKLDSAGAWLWAKKAGGTAADTAYNLALDSSANVYLSGTYKGTATFSSSLTSAGDEDMFIAKLNSSGTWSWAKSAGGASLDRGYGMTVKSADTVYLTGYFGGMMSFGSTTIFGSYGPDLFVAKLGTTAPTQSPKPVYVYSEPSGANVRVNYIYYDWVTPCTINLAPGNSISVSVDMGPDWMWDPGSQTVNYSTSPQSISFMGWYNPPMDMPEPVNVYSNPSGADVYIDGTWVGNTPYSTMLGVWMSMEISVSMPDWIFEPYSQFISYMGGGMGMSHEVSFTGTMIPPIDMPEPVYVLSEPSGANVYINGLVVGTTPYSGSVDPWSSLSVSVQMEGYTFEPESELVTWMGGPGPNSHTISFVGTQTASQVTINVGGLGFLSIDSVIGGVHSWIYNQGTDQYIGFIHPGETWIVSVEDDGNSFGGYFVFSPSPQTVNYSPEPQVINFSSTWVDMRFPVNIVSVPSGAEVIIDGNSVGITPYQMMLAMPDIMIVSVHKQGWSFDPESQTVMYTPSQQTFSFTGTPLVTIDVDPIGMGASIYINNNFVATDHYEGVIAPGATWIVSVPPTPMGMTGEMVYSPTPQTVTYSPEPQNIFFSGMLVEYAQSVTITSEPSGAEVIIDGSVGYTPYSVMINPGETFEVSVQLQGWSIEPYSQTVNYMPMEQSFHFTGTQTYLDYTYIDPNDLPPEWVIEDSPYYIYEPIYIGWDEYIQMQEGVEVLMAENAGIDILGTVEAVDVTFAPAVDTLMWGGLVFSGSGGTRNNSTLTGCTIKDALVPITINGCSPIISNIHVTLTDSTVVIPQSGIFIYGDASPRLSDLDMKNYLHGITIIDSTGYLQNTPTLSNIRVQNSSSASRPLENRRGVTITGTSAILDSITVEGYNVGVTVTNPQNFRIATPTLTNIRVNNSSSSSRQDDIGVLLDSGVAGSISGCTIEGSHIGIKRVNGNLTKVENNLLLNNEIGFQSAEVLQTVPLRYNDFVLQQNFVDEHLTWNFRGLDFALGSAHQVLSNTFYGYQKALNATNTAIEFSDNIIWGDVVIADPFTLNNSQLTNSYNDIRYSAGVYPGTGNLNIDPMFTNITTMDYALHYNSPCIDTGNPLYQDSDGTISDFGAHPYLHLADFLGSAEFVTVGTSVTFENLSLGHETDVTTYAWDLNNDDTIESTQRDFVYTFETAGIYGLRLTTHTGNLMDEKIVNNVIVVQNEALQPPEEVTFTPLEDGIVLSWAPVILNVENEELPNPVNHYLIYHSATPDGAFDFLDYTSGGQTSLEVHGGNSHFYFVIGFDGTDSSLREYISRNQKMRP